VDLLSEHPPIVSNYRSDFITGFTGKKTDKFHLFFFNDILVYILKSEVKKVKDVSKMNTNLHFNLVWVDDGGEDLLIIRSPNRKLMVHFPTQTEKTKWWNELNSRICKTLQPYPENSPSNLELPPPGFVFTTPPAIRYGSFSWESDIMSYTGWWWCGSIHSEGTLTYFGNRYQGSFNNGIREGCGELSYCNGYVYTGHFSRDLPNGEGKLVSPSNDVYTGVLLVGFGCGVECGGLG
jgi:hypothetical protein